MDYQKHYDRLIERAKHRTLEGYKEKHHIIPRCMGGDDSPENIVELTGSEHFVAHQLLAKMHPTHHGIVHAAKILMGSTNYNNKQFEWVRKLAVETSRKFHTGRKRSEETRRRISEATKGKRKGIKLSEEHRQKLSASLKGRVFTEEHKRNIASREITQEWRDNISKAGKGRKLSQENVEKWKRIHNTPEMKQKYSELSKSRPYFTCPHCGKTANQGNYVRWHGDNCKKKVV